MPEALAEQPVHCPYCGERIELLIDGSQLDQDYIEDCFVCCRPIRVIVKHGPQGLSLQVLSEND